MNIELHGFIRWTTETQKSIWSKLITELPREKSAVCCVTTFSAETQGRDGRIAPFIRIYSTDQNDFEIAIRLLKDVRMPSTGIQTYVECILLERRCIL